MKDQVRIWKSLGFHLKLFANLADDIGEMFSLDLSRDVQTVVSRTIDEGYEFLCGSLSSFGKNILLSLENGHYVNHPSFKRARRNSPLPAFLQGLVSVIFDKRTGCLTDDPKIPDALAAIQQLTRLFSKLDLPYSTKKNDSMVEKFVESNRKIGDFVWELSDEWILKVVDNMKVVLSEVLSDFDGLEIQPRHGPGAVYERQRLYGKYNFEYDPDVNDTYPYWLYFSLIDWDGSQHHYLPIMWAEGEGGSSCQPVAATVAAERLTRICLVPKDYRGPRIIGAEPCRGQFLQQGLGRRLMDHLESHPTTSGFVNFKDQGVNANLALTSSASQEYSTVDLSSASDLISWTEHVKLLFPRHVSACLSAVRTNRAMLPSGEVIDLHMHAGMGSAVCFPVESLLFFAIGLAVIESVGNYRQGDLYVYGDDIIIKTQYIAPFMFFLERAGMKPNMEKSYSSSYFRESCGMEAYAGVETTPSYVRKLHPTCKLGRHSRPDNSAIVSYVQLGNALWDKGFHRAAWCIANMVEEACNRHGKTRRLFRDIREGYVDESCVAFKFTGISGPLVRYNKDLQRKEIRTVRAKVPELNVSPLGLIGCFDWFTKLKAEQPADPARERLEILKMRSSKSEVDFSDKWLPPFASAPKGPADVVPDPRSKDHITLVSRWSRNPS